MPLTDSANSLIEDGLETLLRQRGTLKVLHSTDIPRHRHTLRILYRRHAAEDGNHRKWTDNFSVPDGAYRSLSFSMVPGSSRRSSLVPTRTIDVDGA